MLMITLWGFNFGGVSTEITLAVFFNEVDIFFVPDYCLPSFFENIFNSQGRFRQLVDVVRQHRYIAWIYLSGLSSR